MTSSSQKNEQFYHVVSIADEFLIPVSAEYEKETTEE